MNELESYYLEESWIEFSDLYKGKRQNFNEKIKVLNLLNFDERLTDVIFGIFENNSFKWINNSVPALGNLKAVECLGNPNLEKRLKVCLMRMNK